MNMTDDKGQTPLIKAILSNNIEIAKLLIENDCDVNKPDNELKTALHYTLAEGKDDLSVFLVLYGADINAKDRYSNIPREYANLRLR